MVAVGVKDGRITEIYAALPVRDENGNLGKTTVYGPFGKDDKRMNRLWDIILETDKLKSTVVHLNESDEERAVLVGLETSSRSLWEEKRRRKILDELEELARTAGAVVLEK